MSDGNGQDVNPSTVSAEPASSIRPDRLFKKLTAYLGALVSLAIVSFALWVLHHTLKDIEIEDVLKSFHDLPASSFLLGLGVTALSYFVVTGYDVLALRHIQKPLPYWRAGLAGFLASAFGNNIGFSVLTGASIRYRIYSQAGLSALEIAGVSMMCSMTTAMGMAFILALSMLLGTGQTADTAIHLPTGLRHILGFMILTGMAAYLGVSAFRPVNIQTRNWSLQLPSARTAFSQGFLATLDMLLVGSLIYVLLPAHAEINFFNFMGIFALAIIAGSMSNVPGGIGVFETVFLLGLPEIPPAALLGAILLFRCVYYLTPLGVAAIAFATHEVTLQHARLVQGEKVDDWLKDLGPQVMSVIMLFAGALLLLSGAIPISRERLPLLESSFSLIAVEWAHIAGSVAGLGLVVLAPGIAHRLEKAHTVSAALLAVGVVASLFKGLDYEEAIALSVMLAVLLPTRPVFDRPASLSSYGFSVEWVSTLAVVLATTVWLGFFNYRRDTYSSELWSNLSFEGDLARFLRSTWVVLTLTGGLALFRLLRPGPEPRLPGPDELERAYQIKLNEPDTRANLVFLGDKRLLFSASGNAFLMYQVQGKSWVALGNAIGPAEERPALADRFHSLSGRYGGWPIFYLIDAEGTPLYEDMGLSVVKLGDEGRVPLATFSVQDVASAEIRDIHRRVSRSGVFFEIVPSSRVPLLLPALKEVSAAWLTHANAHEQGFSKGFFDAGYIARMPCAVVRQGNRIIAFAVLWASRNKEELALDLMRTHPDALEGITDYLLMEILLGGKAQGYQWFNLGVAPLADVATHPLAPLWLRIGKYVYRQSEHFQDMESLRRYEDNFRPVWRPKYLASPGGLQLPQILEDISRLISRGAT
jgi:phosphatidylglycerol lysyltransferase